MALRPLLDNMAYRPAADLAERFLRERLVSRIWDRDIGVWGAETGTREARSIATRLGWLDVARTLQPELERVDRVAFAARQERIQTAYVLAPATYSP